MSAAYATARPYQSSARYARPITPPPMMMPTMIQIGSLWLLSMRDWQACDGGTAQHAQAGVTRSLGAELDLPSQGDDCQATGWVS